MDTQFAEFLLSTRNSLISRNQLTHVQALVLLLQALDACDAQEQRYVVEKLVNLDFLTHFAKVIVSKPLILKLSMKVALIFGTHETFRKFYPDVVKAHLRAFMYIVRKNEEEEKILINEAAIFLAILNKR